MRRRAYLIGLCGTVTAGIAGCMQNTAESDDPNGTSGDPGDPSDPNAPDEPSEPVLENPSFEDELAGWTIGKDLPTYPGESSEPVDHSATVASERASNGESSLELYIDGSADDGTIWVEQTIDATDVERVSVDVYSEMNSANRMSQVAFFAGEKPDDGLSEENFDRDRDIEDHSGWKSYSYSVSELSGEATIAIGMNIVWETDIRRFFDNVQLVEE